MTYEILVADDKIREIVGTSGEEDYDALCSRLRLERDGLRLE
jgi:hypothetical protein